MGRLFKISLFYLFASLIVITILSILLVKKTKHESFCNCSGMQGPNEMTRQDPALLKALYNSGQLTEFSDLNNGKNPHWKNLLKPSFQPYNNYI